VDFPFNVALTSSANYDRVIISTDLYLATFWNVSFKR
jgi:hypothetical protein